MSIFAIADLHLDTESQQKSMEVFGNRWKDYVYKLQKNWKNLVSEQDTVVVPGDISWALTLPQALPDLLWLHALPGQKILLKGNHDFWWSTASKMNQLFEEHHLDDFWLLNNNAFEVEDYILAGSRGWFTDSSMQNTAQEINYQKIINREVIRLRLSLEQANVLRQKSGKEILVFLHFPPIWGDFCCREILNVLREYQITRVFFGHIHSLYSIPAHFEQDGIQFHIVSADYLDFIPYII